MDVCNSCHMCFLFRVKEYIDAPIVNVTEADKKKVQNWAKQWRSSALSAATACHAEWDDAAGGDQDSAGSLEDFIAKSDEEVEDTSKQ